MGTLVAMHYPTVLAFGAADHTYVRCGTGGKAWSCWGGKTGGTVLCSGTGSTNQADAIAGANERAGVTCYLINGVCHQAANRILFPAGILVTGARGYGVSSAIFGPYGRPRGPFGTCSAPFNQHTGTTGDLPECADAPMTLAATQTTQATRSPEEQRYIERVSSAYGQVHTLGLLREARRDPDLVDFMLQLFDYQVEYSLREKPAPAQATRGAKRTRAVKAPKTLGRLRDFRAATERSRIRIETDFSQRKIPVAEFVVKSDLEAIDFQKNAATVLNEDQYQALFHLKKGEFIALADPAIVPHAYPHAAL
jgi:hypothetical protein